MRHGNDIGQIVDRDHFHVGIFEDDFERRPANATESVDGYFDHMFIINGLFSVDAYSRRHLLQAQ